MPLFFLFYEKKRPFYNAPRKFSSSSIYENLKKKQFVKKYLGIFCLIGIKKRRNNLLFYKINHFDV